MAGRLFADGYESVKRPRLMAEQGMFFDNIGGGMGNLGPLGFGGSPHLAAAMAASMGPNHMSMLPRMFPVVKLRGLPFNCTDTDVIDFFMGLDVVDVLLMRRNGRFSGEAFVVFGAPVQVDYALQKNRQNMGRRYIEVFRAKKADYYTAISNEVAMGPPEDAGEGPPPTERPDRRRLNSVASIPSGSRVNQDKRPTEPTSVLKMRGLPFSVAKQDIIEFFQGFALADESIHIVASAEGRPKGEAFVEFSTPGDARDAMSKDKMLLGKRYVELFYSSREEATRVARLSEQ